VAQNVLEIAMERLDRFASSTRSCAPARPADDLQVVSFAISPLWLEMERTILRLSGIIRGGRLVALPAIPVALMFLLSACASWTGPEVLQPVAVAPGIRTLPIYVATNRKRADPSGNVFTAESANALNFAKFTISIPPGHKTGNIEWPEGKSDPRVSFATVAQTGLSEGEFRQAVAPLQRSSRLGKKHDVLIFVHGYNNNFQESLFRLAQIAADTGTNGIPILFAWPSQGEVVAYEADREIAVQSRDYLAALLTMVTSSPQVGEVLLVAHSVGGMLTAETLRQLRAQKHDRVIARLGSVILAAPDIDVSSFQTQLQAIGPLKPPLTVLVSKDDVALRFSSFIGGSRARAGALDVDNPLVREAALKAKVRIVDISELPSPDGTMHHDRFVSLAAFYPRLQRVPAAERQRPGVFLFDGATANAIPVGDSTSGY